MTLSSTMYRLTVGHHRHWPKPYAFAHQIFMFYLDLSELEVLSTRFKLFGNEKKSIYEFNRRDHFDMGQQDVAGNIKRFIAVYDPDVANKVKQIKLLTHVRTWGYIFNPVSFFYCFDEHQAPLAVVMEIGNTFGELKPYYISPACFDGKVFRARMPKNYYISPFTRMDDQLDVVLGIPGDEVYIGIDVLNPNNQRYFCSYLKGNQWPVTTGHLWQSAWQYPLMTLQVIFLIHWHAMILAGVKRLPFFRKEACVDLQTQVFRVYRHTAQPANFIDKQGS